MQQFFFKTVSTHWSSGGVIADVLTLYGNKLTDAINNIDGLLGTFAQQKNRAQLEHVDTTKCLKRHKEKYIFKSCEILVQSACNCVRNYGVQAILYGPNCLDKEIETITKRINKIINCIDKIFGKLETTTTPKETTTSSTDTTTTSITTTTTATTNATEVETTTEELFF